MIRRTCLRILLPCLCIFQSSQCWSPAVAPLTSFNKCSKPRLRTTLNYLTVRHFECAVSFLATPLCMVGDAQGEYYGESAGSYMVQEFNTYDQLADIVKMSSLPLPERPDGVVTVVKYTSASSAEGSRATEAEYERLARKNPSTLFLRCFAEYEDAEILFGQAGVVVRPTFDVFYRGNRVARVEGPNQIEVEQLLERYQFQNSKLDLFSEESPAPWGTTKVDHSKTPRTTNRFIPGYDWDSNRGFFDATADKMEEDFMGMFENSWLPNSDDINDKNM